MDRRVLSMKKKLVQAGVTQPDLRQKIANSEGEEQLKYLIFLAILRGSSVKQVAENKKVSQYYIYKLINTFKIYGYKELKSKSKCPKIDSSESARRTIKITDNLHKKLSDYTYKNRVTLRDTVSQAIKQYILKPQKEIRIKEESQPIQEDIKTLKTEKTNDIEIFLKGMKSVISLLEDQIL